MSRRLLTEDEAERELEEAASRYEDRRPGLGADFLDAVTAALEYISHWPATGAPVPRVPKNLPVRRVSVKGFPYHVIFLETTEAIRILAFAHDRRHPGYWFGRVQ